MSATPTEPDAGVPAVRFPGGRLRAEDWTTLAAMAADAAADLHLTARGGIAVRRADGTPVAYPGSASAGLVGRHQHPRGRDIIASPLAGRLSGRHHLGDLPERLQAALLGRAETETLSEDVLFGLDDGTGDVLAHSPDLTAVAAGTGGSVRVHVAGRDTSVWASLADAATILADAAARFAAQSGGASRVPASGRLHDLVVDVVRSHPLTATAGSPGDPRGDGSAPAASATASATAVDVPPVGWIDAADGSVSLLAVVPRGVVSARLAEFLGAVDRPSTVSADRVIGLHELTEGMAEQIVRVLAPMGMVFDATSEWVTAPR